VRGGFFLTIGLLLAAACRDKAPVGAFYGVRLAMTASDLRAHFEPGAPGHWHTETTPDREIAMVWAADAPERHPAVLRARFEIHSGLLVAIRAEARTEGPPLEKSLSAVLARHPLPGDRERASITILARDCPTHADEARALLAGH
jgi:hypothetical protein